MKEFREAFGLGAAELDAAGAHWTAREILQQPQLWADVERLTAADAPRLKSFLGPVLAEPELRIILTGAGTSSFIGECLAPALSRVLPCPVEAIPTTDLVASPRSWLRATTPTLLVSFARSGNSPESVAALELGDRCIERCHHLVVTCNAHGELYQSALRQENACPLLLPEASHDKSFAMTSSFTGMLLAAARVLGSLPAGQPRAAALGALARQVLPGCAPLLASLTREGFERVVCLGSNELKGLAREAALKMLELTDGKVVAVADSALGFRHGPKTILNHKTLVVAFISNDPHTRRYDLDLVRELRRDAVAGPVVALSSAPGEPEHDDDIVLADGMSGAARASDLELCLPYALFAQTLAMLRSISLGVRPDNPNAAGMVSRVVRGVTIYPFGESR